MAESSITVAGAATHTNTRTISATTMHDQYVLPGEFAYASYVVATASTSIATADAHIVEIMAGASLNVRIRCIHIECYNNAGTAIGTAIELWRLSTAGTGGTAVTPRPLDTADSAAGLTAMTLPSAKGTETVLMGRRVLTVRQTISTLGGAEDVVEWLYGDTIKSLILPSGTSNGLAVKVVTGAASATVGVEVYAVETAFV
jgi:hypothetical protein